MEAAVQNFFGLKVAISILIFFHALATARREKNKIKKLQDDSRAFLSELNYLCHIAWDYLDDLFSLAHKPNYGSITSYVESKIDEVDNEFLLRSSELLFFICTRINL